MRLIDADRLFESIYDSVSAPYEDFVAAKEECLREIEDAPTVDAVVVTRCKDCEYLVNATVNDNGFLICDISDMEIAPDDFCSYGQKKETTQSLRP